MNGARLIEADRLPQPTTYADVAPIYWKKGFSPIPARGKRPVPKSATGRNGVVNEEKVASWASDPEWASQNTALRADGYIAIDVDHYGDRVGADQLAELEAKLGTLPATPTSTSRGQDSPSRQHFYLVPEGVQFDTQPAPDIEMVQFHHRYSIVWPSVHPDTGEIYRWYDANNELMTEPPGIDDFERLPEAWLEHLRVEAREHAEQSDTRLAYDGPQVEAASPDEERKLNVIVESLRALPAAWVEGAGWHDTVYRASCWMWRMINSGAYAVNEEQALGLMLSNTPTYPEWSEDRILEQWASAKESTAGQLEETPVANIPDLLPFISTANLLPESTSRGVSFMGLVTGLPEVRTDGMLWEHRRTVIRESLMAGLSDQEAYTIAWACKAAMALQGDPMGSQKLWREVEKVSAEVARSRGDNIEAAAESDRPPLVVERDKSIDLLTEYERSWLATPAPGGDKPHGYWFGDRYMEWAYSRVKPMNAPYHRMNRWVLLSLVLSPLGVIRLGAKKINLAFFAMIIGESSTGKSESKDLLREAIYPNFSGDSPNIGGNASPNALTERLIERDGRVSWFNVDEATRVFKEMQGGNNSWLSGIIELWNELFDGRVPIILRNGKKDISGIDATTHFVIHMFGVLSKMANVIDADLWESGFLPRFVWAIGEPPVEDDEADELNLLEGDLALVDDPLPVQWADEFANIRSGLEAGGTLPMPMRMDADAKDRHKVFTQSLKSMIAGHKHIARLKPTQTRFGTNILKCAALVALSEGKTTISLRHELIAIEQAEEWWANAVFMVNATDETPEIRRVNELERMISRRPNQMMPLEKINLESPHNHKVVDGLISQLVSEGRVTRFQQKSGAEVVQLKLQEAA